MSVWRTQSDRRDVNCWWVSCRQDLFITAHCLTFCWFRSAYRASRLQSRLTTRQNPCSDSASNHDDDWINPFYRHPAAAARNRPRSIAPSQNAFRCNNSPRIVLFSLTRVPNLACIRSELSDTPYEALES